MVLTRCNDPRKSISHICAIPQKDQLQLRLLAVVNKAQFNPVNTRYETHHTPTHITQSIKFWVSQSPPLKSLTSLLGPTLWGSVSEPTQGYRACSDTICNDPRKSTSHICAIPQKDQSQLKLLAVVNKAQFNPINTRCGTHQIPHTHHTINQIGASQSPPLKSQTSLLGPTLWGSVSEPTRSYQAGSDIICNDQGKVLVTFVLYLKRTSHN